MARTARTSWWLIFGSCCVLVAATLTWATVVVLRLERAEATIRMHGRGHEAIRLALWRMDSWLLPRLARETTRPFFEYQAYYSLDRAYTRILGALQPGEVLTPSPLLLTDSPFFPLHFQITSDNTLSSPEIPEGNYRDLAEATLLASGVIQTRQSRFAELAPLLSFTRLETSMGAAEAVLVSLDELKLEQQQAEQYAGQWTQPRVRENVVKQLQQGSNEYSNRAANTNYARTPDGAPTPRQTVDEEVQQLAEVDGPPSPQTALAATSVRVPEVGSFVPLWVRPNDDTPEGAQLLFARRIVIGRDQLIQGFLVDWDQVRASLYGEVEDLLDTCLLEPVFETSVAADRASRQLATIPVEVIAPSATDEEATLPVFTTTRLTLGLTWLAALVAMGAVGVTLRKSIDFGQRRGRFASAVTHELRTPLTTFRMYSEMLADGMIQDEAQRASYLATLKSESARLAALVENVLAYARIEDGRPSRGRWETLSLDDLVTRHLDDLDRRAETAGMHLDVDLGEAGSAKVHTNADAVGQVLFNVIDNACKYACDAKDCTIHVSARTNGSRVGLDIADHGPGIPTAHTRRIFDPFERGPRDPGDDVPGVGLGLALSRELARDMGGDLEVQVVADRGASFRLTLPLASETV